MCVCAGNVHTFVDRHLSLYDTHTQTHDQQQQHTPFIQLVYCISQSSFIYIQPRTQHTHIYIALSVSLALDLLPATMSRLLRNERYLKI